MKQSKDIKPTHNRLCAVCGGGRKKLIFEQRFFPLSQGALLAGYQIVSCLDCGFCFADDIPEQSVFDKYYREMSKYENKAYDRQESTYDLARHRYVFDFIKPYLNHQETRIFEIGCSTGTLLSLFKKDGYLNLSGLDPSPSCAETARRLHGIQIITSSLAELLLPENSVDFLIMVGVLEHIRDLTACLRQLWNMLAPAGQLCICVPNAALYQQGEDAPFQEFSIEHINFFGPISLQNLVSSHGFTKTRCHETLLQTNYCTFNPVILSIFQKELNKSTGFKLLFDFQTEEGLNTYIQKSIKFDSRVQSIIENIALEGKPIIVWGAGTHTLRLLANTSLAHTNIVAFVDANPNYHGKKLMNIPIISPFELKDYAPSYPILISSRGFQEEISKTIKNNLNLNNDIIVLYDL